MITTIATTCTAVIGTLTIACFIFYRKSEIDDKFAIMQKLISDNQLTNQKRITLLKKKQMKCTQKCTKRLKNVQKITWK